MRSGPLVEQLIAIAGISKSAFADAVGLSASSLSRFLSGRRQPGIENKRTLSVAAADVLTQHIYEPNCWYSLSGLFPVLYDFGNRYELRLFLASAIEYALDMDLGASLETVTDYPDSEHTWLGPRRVLNMLCVILSDAIRTNPEDDLEFYSTLPLLFSTMPQSVSRMRFMFAGRGYRVTWNQALNQADFPADFGTDNPLDIIKAVEEHCNLRLWETRTRPSHFFVLLKDTFLITLDILPDSTPSLTLIRNRNYLMRFHRFILNQRGRQLSYTGSEIRERLEAEPDLLERLLERLPKHKLIASYHYVNFGLFLTDEELAAVEPDPERRGQLLAFFHGLLNADAAFYPSAASIGEFVRTGRTVVPFSGTLYLPAEQRVAYLRRFEDFACKGTLTRTSTLYDSNFNAAILCAEDLTLLYFINQDGSGEKVHFLHTSGIDRLIESVIKERHLPLLPYSGPAWYNYLDEVEARLS